jgi:hypothetical protein
VSLEKDGEKYIACEISVTSTDEQELGNIEKCLNAGYMNVIFCSTERKMLEKVKVLVSQRLEESAQSKVIFLKPDEVIVYLRENPAYITGGEERVKGYRVNVQYQAVEEPETKREAVAQVIAQAMQRLKKK